MVNIGTLKEVDFVSVCDALANKYSPVIKRETGILSDSSVITKIKIEPDFSCQQHSHGGSTELGVIRNGLNAIFGDSLDSHSHHESPYFTILQPFHGNECDDNVIELLNEISDQLPLKYTVTHEGDLQSLVKLNQRMRTERDEYRKRCETLKGNLDQMYTDFEATTKEYEDDKKQLDLLKKENHAMSMRKTLLATNFSQTKKALEDARLRLEYYKTNQDSLICPSVLEATLSELEDFDLSELNMLVEYKEKKDNYSKEYLEKLDRLIKLERDNQIFTSVQSRLESEFFGEVEKSKDFWVAYKKSKDESHEEVNALSELLDFWENYHSNFNLDKQDRKDLEAIGDIVKKEMPGLEFELPDDLHDFELSVIALELFDDSSQIPGTKLNATGRRHKRLCKRIIESIGSYESLQLKFDSLGFNGKIKYSSVRDRYLESVAWLNIGKSYTSLRKSFRRTQLKLKDQDKVFDSMLEFMDRVANLKSNLENLLDRKV